MTEKQAIYITEKDQDAQLKELSKKIKNHLKDQEENQMNRGEILKNIFQEAEEARATATDPEELNRRLIELRLIQREKDKTLKDILDRLESIEQGRQPKANTDPNKDVAYHLQQALRFAREAREMDSNDVWGRHCSIAITELEKIIAFWQFFLM